MWKCLKCGEQHDDAYDTCWKCSSGKTGSLESNHVSRDRRETEDTNLSPDEIVHSIAAKYIQHKDSKMMVFLLSLFLFDEDIKKVFEKRSLDKVEALVEEWLANSMSVNYSDADELNTVLKAKKEMESFLELTADLKRMLKLLQKKDITTDYLQLISVLHEIAESRANEEVNRSLDEFFKPAIEAMSRITKTGDYITIENIIRQFAKIRYYRSWIIDSDEEKIVGPLIYLLSNFGMKIDSEEVVGGAIAEVSAAIVKIKEEVETLEFEKSLESGEKRNSVTTDYNKLNGYEFEEFLKNIFKDLGYIAIQTPLSGDQGADLVMSKDSKKIVVQAKKYTGKVANKAIQEVIAARGYYKADEAIVVTNNFFTESAIELALKCNIELWDGDKLKEITEKLLKTNKKDFSPSLLGVQ